MTALIRYRPHGAGILDRNKRDGAVLVLGDTMKSASVWSDMSGRGNHGLVYGAGTPPAATPGALGYLFDGVDDYVNAGNAASLNITNAITISAWVFKKNNSITGHVLGKRTATTGYFLYDASETTMIFTVKIGGVSKSATTNSQTFLNNWNHVVGVYNGSNVIIYVNGIKQTLMSSITGNIDSNTNSLFVGSYDGTVQFFDGSIDEVRIFNRALNATEIKRLYERTRILFGV